MKTLINQLRCRFHLFWLTAFSRDAQLKTLIEKLRSAGFNFARFESEIQHRPRRWKLFLQALIHRSYLQIIDEPWESNERLEFLGDAILSFVVAEYLFRTYPDREEGDLTKLRSRLVNRKALAQCSKDIHVNRFLLMSTSAAQSIDSGAESIIADAYESIVCALYLDGGFPAARKFIHATLLKNPEILHSAMTDDNYKSALLEYAQAHALGIPRYNVILEEGPEHDRRFTVEVCLGTAICGHGSGRSKKEAEQSAAAYAIEHIQGQEIHISQESIHAAAK